jgi:hypothetical protein
MSKRPVTLLATFFFTTLGLCGQGALPALVPLAARDAFTVWLGRPFDTGRMTVISKGTKDFDWSDPLAVLPDGETVAIPLPPDSVADVMAVVNWGTRTSPRVAIGYQRLRHPLVLPPPDRGTVAIVIDAEAARALDDVLTEYRNVLRREGFATHVVEVQASSNPADAPDVRRAIRRLWQRSDIPQVTHVVLIGAVPVPYSGGFNVNGAFPNPDFHPEHGGAWPADAYYGDMDRLPGSDAETSWTDAMVTIADPAVADRVENRNVPGDGKFDQSQIPTDIELAVGRIDMRKLWAIGVVRDDRTRELELLRRYLQRNIQLRQQAWRDDGTIIAGVDDNFGLFERRAGDFVVTEAFAASGLRSWMAVVNDSMAIRAVDFVRNGASSDRPILDSASVLLAYGCGPGGYSHCDFVANVELLRSTELRARHVLLLGSYFGDSDSDDNLMRTMLGVEGTTLTVGWSGRPHWFLHPMAADATIGECLVLTQNNAGEYLGATSFDTRSGNVGPFRLGERGTYLQLIGDPTLRLPAPTLPRVTVSQDQNGNLEFRTEVRSDHDSIVMIVDQASELDGTWSRLAALDIRDFPVAGIVPAATTRFVRVRAVSTRQRNADAPFERIVGLGTIAEIRPTTVQEIVDHHTCQTPEWFDLLGRRSQTRPTSGVWIERCMGRAKVVTF